MKLFTSTLSSKGQTTIPQAVRESLGVGANDLIAYEIVDGKVILRPMRNRLLELGGSIKPKHKPEDFKAIRKSVAAAIGRAAVKRG